MYDIRKYQISCKRIYRYATHHRNYELWTVRTFTMKGSRRALWWSLHEKKKNYNLRSFTWMADPSLVTHDSHIHNGPITVGHSCVNQSPTCTSVLVLIVRVLIVRYSEAGRGSATQLPHRQVGRLCIQVPNIPSFCSCLVQLLGIM